MSEQKTEDGDDTRKRKRPDSPSMSTNKKSRNNPGTSESTLDSKEETTHDDSGNESSGDNGFREDVDSQPEIEDYPFEVLSTEEIVQHMMDSIQDVNNIIGIPATTTRILLNHFKWDKEKLMERFYDGNQEQLFAEARVVNPFTETPTVSRPETVSRTAKCDICYTLVPSLMMTGLECSHMFCTQCWGKYLTNKIMDEGVGQTIACMACDIIVDDATVMRLVEDTRVLLKYQQLITNSFVECNRLLRWCPSPDCNNAVEVSNVEARAVMCKCLHTFCFACGEEWHDPVKCQLLKIWIKKCEDDSETSNWIAANTKECPKCNATIEKNGGCNHMVCKNQNCNEHFCWVCLGRWQLHVSYYKCNRYDENEAQAARDAQEKHREPLRRYLFYYNHYLNHMQSLKFEHKLYSSVKEKMEEIQQLNITWVEVQCLKRAVDILCQCRQTLMYTYAFAYYLQKNNQSTIFEDNQRDLQSATETLSEYLERDITSANLADIKQKVQDKYRYCERRRKLLLKHVEEGYEKDWWKYTIKL